MEKKYKKHKKWNIEGGKEREREKEREMVKGTGGERGRRGRGISKKKRHERCKTYHKSRSKIK